MYCTQCHRECEGAGDAQYGFAEVSKCHRAPVLDGEDKWIVMAIRRLWAADAAMITGKFEPDYPFGTGIEQDADVKLLEAFVAERPHHDSDLDAIWALIRG